MTKTAKKSAAQLLWPDEIRPAVTILIRAGVVENQRDSRFVAEVSPGTRGAYVGPHPNRELADDGWHMVDVLDGYVPLHRSQFERAD